MPPAPTRGTGESEATTFMADGNSNALVVLKYRAAWRAHGIVKAPPGASIPKNEETACGWPLRQELEQWRLYSLPG